ncbi:putative endonuclease 8 2 [Sphaerisporangium melleum]|uniref:DNA-(apurinic or apyrimidinic site) lyase n=1 Tax=Sphaerisporangium melleum TaxID=321316 RepID=A0A917R234_9ACTN|nr:DNA-formamidopyrimidine glycosylase family protein [Sphaerisporangium melleum]GGK83113.1 putative endonuclease 8 2 [Sphaerisporangium melleum]GII69242.1 putative endonuclease 8 2 [Sphaerisporangium melleum]
MPEGDAVYRAGARLRAALDGRVLTRSDFRVPRHATADLTGRAVLTTATRGKHLLTRVEGGLTVHTHLRMDGSWRVERAGAPLRAGHLIRLILANERWQAAGIRLGVVDLLRTEQEDRVVGHLGPDLLDPHWDDAMAARAAAGIAARPGTTIGEALLDQRNVAGIGTIWRAETLFLSGVSPFRPAGEVEDLKGLMWLAHRLMDAGKEESGGPVTTGDRRPGRRMWAYGRAGRPCLRCGATMIGGELGARPYERVIFYCPACQPR